MAKIYSDELEDCAKRLAVVDRRRAVAAAVSHIGRNAAIEAAAVDIRDLQQILSASARAEGKQPRNPDATCSVTVLLPFRVAGREVQAGEEVNMPRFDAESLAAAGRCRIL